MSRVVKIVAAVIVTLLCMAGVGMLAMRDASRRPEYCKTCHVVEPYYQTWASGDLLARSHALAAVPCQRCHPQDLRTILQENVTNLQGGNTIRIASVAWTDQECLSCHGDQAALVESTKNLDPNPHASPHPGAKLDCSRCHRMHEPSEYPCIQCHAAVKTGPGWTTKVSQTLDIQIWSPDMECTVCHTMAPYVDSLENPNLLAYTHAQQGLKCQDCHTDAAALQQAHEKAVPGEPVKPLRVSMDTCLGCHAANQHTSWDQVIARTQDYVIDGKNINPHAPHPESAGVAQTKCSECHMMHQESPLLNGCYTCHHMGTVESCGACHEPSFYKTQ